MAVHAFSASQPMQELVDYWLFSFLGVIGAIFANSTGAGGGVVFIPMFAKTLVTHMSATRLKLFFAIWLLITRSLGII